MKRHEHTYDLIKNLVSEERKKIQDANNIVKQLKLTEYHMVVDLGSGPGYFTLPLAMVARKGIVYAIEKDELMISFLKENIKKEGLSNVDIINALAERISIKDSSIDLVFIACVFHDIGDHDSLMKEVKRILKKNGRVVNIDWNKRCKQIGPPLNIRMSKKEEIGIFKKYSFILEREINAGPCHYGFIMLLASS